MVSDSDTNDDFQEPLREKVREAFEDIKYYDENFLAGRQEVYWELVEKVIKRREVQLRKAHAKRIALKRSVLGGTYVPDKKDDRDIGKALEIASAKKQFVRLFNRNLKKWRSLRGREIRIAMLDVLGRNHGVDNKEALEQRLKDIDGEIAWVSRDLGHYSAYESVRWLWSDFDKIDIMSLEGRTLEDRCYD